MRKSLIGILFLAAAIAIAVPTAKASKTELKIISDGSTLYKSGPQSTSTLSTSLTTIGGWDVMLTAGSSNSPRTLPYGLGLLSFDVSCAFAACEGSDNSLTIEFSGRGFTETTATPPDFDVSYLLVGASAGSSTTLTGYYGHGLLKTTHQIGSPLTFTGPVTVETIATTGSSHSPHRPYSLTLTDTFTAGSGGATFLGADGLISAEPEPISVEPEPTTMLLFGTGLLLFGIVLRKRLHA